MFWLKSVDLYLRIGRIGNAAQRHSTAGTGCRRDVAVSPMHCLSGDDGEGDGFFGIRIPSQVFLRLNCLLGKHILNHSAQGRIVRTAAAQHDTFKILAARENVQIIIATHGVGCVGGGSCDQVVGRYRFIAKRLCLHKLFAVEFTACRLGRGGIDIGDAHPLTQDIFVWTSFCCPLPAIIFRQLIKFSYKAINDHVAGARVKSKDIFLPAIRREHRHIADSAKVLKRHRLLAPVEQVL